jgi:ribose transport system substrate-binding protein
MREFLLRRRATTALAAAATVAVLGLTACGGDDADSASDGSAASSTAAASGSAELEAAKARLEAATKAPTTIGPTEPITKPIPTGKSVIYVNCGAVACTNTGAGLKEAAAALGWKYKEINALPTPESIQAAFSQVVREKPDGVASNGFSTAAYQRQLAQMKDAGIAVLSNTGTEPAGDGLLLQLQSDVAPEAMALLADKAVLDAGGKGDFGNVIITGYPIVKQYGEAFTAEVKKICPDCGVKNLDIQPTSIGKDAPAKITNFLRANPSVKGIFLGYDDLANGLATAVRNAGIDMPKSYSWAPTQIGVKALQTGERTAAVAQGTRETGWQFADAFARVFTKQSIEPSRKWQDWQVWSKDYDNVPEDVDNPPVIADYQEQFKKLWNK